MIVGVCCQLDWERRQPFVDRHLAGRLRDMAGMQRGTELLGVDWTSIGTDGAIDAVSPVDGRRFRMALHHLDLLHFCRLGTLPGKFKTLQDKWRTLMDKLTIIDAGKVLCCNSTAALRWGADKRYLEVLAAKGVAVPPTLRIAASLSLAQLRERCGDTYHVVKPANGECGRFVTLAAQLTEHGLRRLKRECTELLLQPLVGEALAGEKSFIFFGTRFSHAVLKIAGFADFRSNGSHTGAKIYGYLPDDAEIDAARALASHFPCPLDTYRVDIIGPPGREIVMEIEAVDPGHFTGHHRAYASEQMKFYQRMVNRS
jgi:hypothetical protein